MDIKKEKIKPKKKLHLGSGKNILKGFINLDKVKLPGIDVVWDLDKFPWPFENNSFDYIISNSTLEHLENLIKVMEEIYRICKNNAIIEIRVPHFSSLGAYKDPTHKIFFTYYTFDYFKRNFNYNFYTKARFDIIKRKIIYGKFFFFFEWMANFYPRFHEIFLRKIFPAKDLFFRLKVIKPENFKN